MQFAKVMFFALLLSTHVPAAGPEEAQRFESLGDELLDDLSPNVLQQSPATSPSISSPTYVPDDKAEAVGRPTAPLSLVRVQHDMQQAHALLIQQHQPANPKSLQEAAQVQQNVIVKLDELINELSKQRQDGTSASYNQPKQPGATQTHPNDTASSAAEGQTAAQDSNTRLDRNTAKSVEKGELKSTLRSYWGHLPEREREHMLQTLSSEFLPKYEREIEQYYRRLSEEQSAEQGR